MPPAEPGTRPIELHQALVLANERSLLLRSVRQQLESARAGLDSAQATRFPTLSADASATNPNAAPFTSVTGGLTLGYDLDTHGARGARIRIGEVQRELAEITLAQTSQSLRYEVSATYYDLQGADEQVRIAALNMSNARTSVRDAEVQREAGEATEFDVQRAQVQFGSAEQGLADARGNLTIARRRLARVLGLDPREALSAASRPIAVPAWKLTLAQSLSQALSRRPELRLRDLSREISLQSAKLAWSARWPQSNLFASGDTTTVAPGLSGGTFGGFPTGPNVTLGARLSWLLVDWGANGAAARQSEIGADIESTQKADVTLQVQLDVEQAYATMTAASANIRSADLALSVAGLGLQSARLRFNGGVGTQTDVLLAQADLVQAEGNRVRAILAFNKAVAQLEQVSAAVGLP